MIFLLVIPAFGGQAFSQIDPDSDGIGIYFDNDGLTNCITGVAPGTYGPGFLYLLVTNPTFPQDLGIVGWECLLEIAGPLVVLDWGLQGPGALNVATPPEFVVGIQSGWLPYGNTIALLDMTIVVEDTEAVEFKIHPAPVPSFGPFPVYVWPTDLDGWVPCQQSTGLDENGEPNVCAAINGGCPVTTKETTWGQLKIIYR